MLCLRRLYIKDWLEVAQIKCSLLSLSVQAVSAERLNRKRMNYAFDITTCEAPPAVATAAAGYKHSRILYELHSEQI